MGSDFLVLLIARLYTYGTPTLILIGLILGFIIIGRKDAPTKLLGIWVVTWSIANLLNFGSRIIGIFFGMEDFVKLMSISYVAGGVLGAVGLIALFLYAKIRYKAKGLIALILIRVSETPLTMLFNYLWKIRDDKLNLTADQLAFAINILKELITLLAMIIILVAYFKHRKSEQNIRQMWLVPFFLVLFSIVSIGLNLYMILMLQGNATYNLTSDSYDMVNTIVSAVPVIIEPIAAIGILAKGRRPFAKKKGAA